MKEIRGLLCGVLALALFAQTFAYFPVFAESRVTFTSGALKSYLTDAYGLDVNKDGQLSRSELSTLTSLVIYSGDIRSLSGLQYATNLKTLDIEGAPLTSLPVSVLRRLKKLQTLIINDTGITSVPANAFAANKGLASLEISDTGLKKIAPGAFAGLSHLSELSLRNDGLTSLPAGLFAPLSALTQLNLSDNALTSLPASDFTGLSNLTTLSLAGNLLADVSGSFAGLSKLATVDLSFNSIKQVKAGTFASVSAVGLSNNEITSVEPGAFSSGSAALVDLTYNNLKSAAPFAGFSGSLFLDNNMLDKSDTATAAAIAALTASCKGQYGFTCENQGLCAALPGGARLTNDGSTKNNVTLTAEAYDSVSVTRGGAAVSFSPGVIYTQPGSYTATLKRGAATSTLSFTIDRTGPEIYASVGENKWSRTNVRVSSSDTIDPFVLRNKNLYWSGSGKSHSYEWDGGTFSKDGRYDLVAYDAAGNSGTFTFYIDKTAPVITVKSIAGGAVIKIKEANIASKRITLNGRKLPWPASGRVSAKGSYTVRVTDKAGNGKTTVFRLS